MMIPWQEYVKFAASESHLEAHLGEVETIAYRVFFHWMPQVARDMMDLDMQRAQGNKDPGARAVALQLDSFIGLVQIYHSTWLLLRVPPQRPTNITVTWGE